MEPLLSNFLTICSAFLCLTALVLSSFFTGSVLRQKLGIDKTQRVLPTIDCGIGLFIFGNLIFFLGLIGQINTIAITSSVLFFPLIICFPLWLRMYKINRDNNQLNLKQRLKFNRFEKITLTLLTIFCLLYFLNGLVPAFGRDAMRYHLYMPQQYINNGSIEPIPMNIFSYFPELIEMLYTYGLLLSNDFFTHMLHWFFGILTAGSIYFIVRTFTGRNQALLGSLIFYSTPVIGYLSQRAYIDIPLAYFQLMGFFFFFQMLRYRKVNFAVVAAIFMAGSVSTKYLGAIGILICLLYGAFTLLQHQDKQKLHIKLIIIFGVITAILGSPWYIRNYISTGNPLYPLLYTTFGGPHWSEEQALILDMFFNSYGMGGGFIDFAKSPFNLIIYGGAEHPFDGYISVLYLLIFSFIFIKKRPRRIVMPYLFFGIVFYVAWFSSSQQIRFLIPSLTFFSIAIATLCKRKKPRERRERKFGTIISLTIVLISCGYLAFPIHSLFKTKPWNFILGKEPKREFLTKNLKNFKYIDYCNTNLSSQQDKIYMVYIGNIGYQCRIPFTQESIIEDYLFTKQLRELGPKRFAKWLKQREITHILINTRSTFKKKNKDLVPTFKVFITNHATVINGDNEVILIKIEQSADAKSQTQIPQQ